MFDEQQALRGPDNAPCVDAFLAAAARPTLQLITVANTLWEWGRCVELCRTARPDAPFGVWSDGNPPAFFSEWLETRPLPCTTESSPFFLVGFWVVIWCCVLAIGLWGVRSLRDLVVSGANPAGLHRDRKGLYA